MEQEELKAANMKQTFEKLKKKKKGEKIYCIIAIAYHVGRV